MKSILTSSLGVLGLLFATSTSFATPEQNLLEKIDGQETAILTDAPAVPPAITRKKATKVVVHLEVKEG